MHKRNSFAQLFARPGFRKLMLATLVFTGMALTACADGDFKKDFDAANQQYDLGKFSEAAKAYSSIIENGHYSPEVFFNLGNANFRLKKNGEAILDYERALALSPNNPEVQANLTYAREQTGAKIAPQEWSDRIIAGFNVDVYCVAAAIAAWACIFILGSIALKLRADNRALWFAAVCFIAIAAYSIFAICQLERNDKLAIVTVKSTDARFAPADNSTLAASLPEGSRVWVLERRGPWWIYCMLPDGSRAWLSSDSVQRVRLHAS